MANLDATALMEQWEQILEYDNRTGILKGQGGDGKPLKITKRQLSGKGPQGPPLAPRGEQSRVIANFVTAHDYDPSKKQWFAQGAWDNVTSKKGVHFLQFHFLGSRKAHLPQRDLRGVRPEGKRLQLTSYRNWISEQTHP